MFRWNYAKSQFCTSVWRVVSLKYKTVVEIHAVWFFCLWPTRSRLRRRGFWPSWRGRRLKGIWSRYVMNIFAYQGRYRTVTGTRYIEVQVCPGCQICMHLARGQPSIPLQPTPMHITLGRENCRLVCKLGTCIPSRMYIFLSTYSSVEFRA